LQEPSGVKLRVRSCCGGHLVARRPEFSAFARLEARYEQTLAALNGQIGPKSAMGGRSIRRPRTRVERLPGSRRGRRLVCLRGTYGPLYDDYTVLAQPNDRLKRVRREVEISLLPVQLTVARRHYRYPERVRCALSDSIGRERCEPSLKAHFCETEFRPRLLPAA
jgi:hypothetical protein